MTQEEKFKKAKRLYETANADQKYVLEKLFPELKESEDEKIRKKIIATIHLYYGEPLEDEAKEMIAWLEKQGKHAKFYDSIQVGQTSNER